MPLDKLWFAPGEGEMDGVMKKMRFVMELSPEVMDKSKLVMDKSRFVRELSPKVMESLSKRLRYNPV
ncbi:hypothetical protein [Falsibacillus albus]|uniref:Uncharacterized protein n=1 Tax=Falsibacillus albus TaxID=2478915 RepID=A0A3L7JS50_9BACI|nr:hypothetical protein [Falsibacillus albus]RLQ93506.1 hypothetical protein D9X91_17560 [Falsibacillus albus]